MAVVLGQSRQFLEANILFSVNPNFLTMHQHRFNFHGPLTRSKSAASLNHDLGHVVLLTIVISTD